MRPAIARILLLYSAYRAINDRCSAFSPAFTRKPPVTIHIATIPSSTCLASEPMGYEKKNAAVDILSNFMETKESGDDQNDPLGFIDFNQPKFQKVDLEILAQILDYELTEKEWFVTGNVNPIYFSDNFEFQDPDVKLSGIENYARGVNKLFNQATSNAQIKSVVVNDEIENTITVNWRLSGKVNIGPKLTIKPYMCSTNFRVEEESGLIDFQEDFFDIPQWDVLLSALFPFLIGKVTSEPAPPIERDDVPVMPKIGMMGKGSENAYGILDTIFSVFNVVD